MAALYLRMSEDSPSSKDLDKVAEVLRNGGLIIYPTDTVYGIGCDITNTKALANLARFKGVKPEKANFSIVCHDLSHLSEYAKVSTPTYKLLKKAFPGAFTFILNASPKLPKFFKGKKTIGIRIPNNNIPRAIVERLGEPIITTSVHDDDKIIEYTTDPQMIYENFKDQVDLVIDGGYGNNIPSTIVDYTGADPLIVREGLGDLNELL
jgi:tRNA threonylcarbamoyl adenosine modification protein (Sua5/YciO/YrdC/YwlC family)